DDFQEARNLLIKVQNQAEEAKDAQGGIDAKGMEAFIAFRQGKKDDAIQLYNTLSSEIERKGEQIADIYKLSGFHQKNYDYLKQAVVCELNNQRIDSAYIKLDNAKSWVLRSGNVSSSGNGILENKGGANLDVASLKNQISDKQLIINYFLTRDTLYTFTVTRDSIKLLPPKAVRFEALHSLVNAYKGAINQTIEIFRSQPTSTFAAHFDSTSALGQRLYDILFGWPELQSLLNQTEMTYIVPDEFLYGLPFSTLRKPDNENFDFLTSQTALTYLPSTRYFQASSNNADFDSKKVLISVDNEINETDRLVSFVKKKFPLTTELAVNKAARNITKHDILKKLQEQYHIFIFLGHSEPNTIFPDSSIFEMTAISLVDSLAMTLPISLGDLKSINWENAEMVLLIGCETAQGAIYRGTGIAGIQQSLLSLGAKEVLASLWKIDADETVSQINLFLKLFLQSGNATLALQEVQNTKVQEFENDNFYKRPHPFIWGSFIHSYTIRHN
ncbi:MAG: CHAT domain-containing protein, partial [bacterium]